MTRIDADRPLTDGVQLEFPRVISLTTAHRLGYSRSAVRHQLERRRWQRLTPGILLTVPSPPTRADWAVAGMELTGPGAALSGRDALRLRGLGASSPPSEEILILDRHGRHRLAGQVRIRPTRRPYHVTTSAAFAHDLAFVPVVSVSRAVADTSLEYRSLAPVRALVTSAIQRARCTPDQLIAELGESPRNWSALFRRALDDVLDGARSIAEAEAVEFLTATQIPSFELNVPVIGADGRVVAVADILWRELRAIAEIDSREFHYDETGWKRTSRRHNMLTAAGFAVQHYPPSEIRGGKCVWADGVASWLRARAIDLGVPYVAGSGVQRPGPGGPEPVLVTLQA